MYAQPATSVGLCFVGGTGRSGTTVLKRLLSSHPEVAALGVETRFLVDPGGLLDFARVLDRPWSHFHYDAAMDALFGLLRAVGARQEAAVPYHARRIARFVRRKMGQLDPTERYEGLNLADASVGWYGHLAQLESDLVDIQYRGRWMGVSRGKPSTMRIGPRHDRDPKAALAGFYRRFAADVAHPESASVFLEDTPNTLLVFQDVLELLPEARLIHMFRDPRDVVASMMGRRWAPSDPVEAARFVARILTAWWRVREDLPSGSFLEMPLESLAAAPQERISELCRFVGVEFDERLLTFDLSRANTGRWQRDIAAADRSEVESVLEEVLEWYFTKMG